MNGLIPSSPANCKQSTLPSRSESTVQKCGCPFNRFPVRAFNQMCIVVEGNARIRVTELSLCDLRSGARLKEDCGVHVPEGMKARPRNLQCIAGVLLVRLAESAESSLDRSGRFGKITADCSLAVHDPASTSAG